MSNGKQATLEDVCGELRISNRLTILSLIRAGIKQKDLAATVGVSDSVISEMFPKGLLKKVGQMSKSGAGAEV